MNTRSNRSRGQAGRVLLVSALAAVLALGVTACSDRDNANQPSSAADVAKVAAAALDNGLEAHAAGDLDKAASEYGKTLELDPKNKFAFYNLALIDAANGNYGLAEQNYRAAITSDPEYEPALFNLAIIRTARDDAKESISLYRRVVAANDKNAGAWLNLGLLQRANGQKAAGNKAVLKAVALDASLRDPQKPAEGAGASKP